jgi:propanediol dehydratase small subunit
LKTRKFDPKKDYPLAQQRTDLVKTLSGVTFSEITLDHVVSGKINPREIRISPETLEYQARVAEIHGRLQLAANFRRAAELTHIPDEEVLRIYNALRPHQATRETLIQMASDLEKKYGAKLNAVFIREAAKVYEKRGCFNKTGQGTVRRGDS